MPVTATNVSQRFRLGDGEQWVLCSGCGRILGKMLANGQLQRKVPEGWMYVIPTPACRVTLTCSCTDPPSQTVLTLNK
jgi:hypothetical protein